MPSRMAIFALEIEIFFFFFVENVLTFAMRSIIINLR